MKTHVPPSELNFLALVIFLGGLIGPKIKENPYYAYLSKFGTISVN